VIGVLTAPPVAGWRVAIESDQVGLVNVEKGAAGGTRQFRDPIRSLTNRGAERDLAIVTVPIWPLPAYEQRLVTSSRGGVQADRARGPRGTQPRIPDLERNGESSRTCETRGYGAQHLARELCIARAWGGDYPSEE